MSEGQTEKRSYKKTLNLPRTGFPMKANLAQNEPKSVKAWKAENIYSRVQAAREGAPCFSFHDGPPYANGDIHVGHLMNKVLKDLVVRSQLMEGRWCAFVPGWDCHGLPIEQRVMEELVESGRIEKISSLEPDQQRMAVRRESQKLAEKFHKRQRLQMESLLTFADYDHPYLTMSPEFEAATLDVFADLCGHGLVYRDLKPVHWSLENRTALAEAELEYMDREDPSVYVEFEAVDRDAVAAAFGVDLDVTPSFMIWTTTPWTLVANLAIAVHERFDYVLARIDGSETVVAKELLDALARQSGAESIEVIGTCPGSKLVGLSYHHPFCDRVGPIVAADYVTLEGGTGLVHTAPGHGADDYRTGLREGLPIYCPVLEDGTYDDSVPEWMQGLSIWEANTRVTELLRDSGHLFHDYLFTHSYPHDWRAKTPVIFRATEQWFIGVDRPFDDGPSLRDRAQHAVQSEVSFVPEWARNRMVGMLETRPDWCLSRQRSWGLPIPSFRRPDGSVFLTPASVRAVGAAFRARGSDAWFLETPVQLLGDYDPSSDPDAPADLNLSDLVKMYDIFDVWFESGSTWNSVCRERSLGYPIDLYLEGSDQHRGWFQASLLTAAGVTGAAPYRTLLTHGFMVDKDGRKMSKSGGNALAVEALLKDYGADVCRWWVSSLAFDGDVKVDLEFFRLAGESYRKVRNTLRFLLSNLDDFDPTSDQVSLDSIEPHTVDGWILGHAAQVERHVRDALHRYAFREAHLALFDFCNDALSSTYCVAVKDRLYCDTPDSPRRRRCQTTMHVLADLLCRLLGPIIPHTANEAFAQLHGEDVRFFESSHLDLSYESAPEWPAVMVQMEGVLKALEEAKSRGIENPLDAGVVVPDPEDRFLPFAEDFADLCGVSRARFQHGLGTIEIEDLRDEPRCERSWKRDPTVAERSDGGMLSDRDAAAIGV
ncbi:MAG: isoleucine--tRNA ligase [Planctomycetota bacterium]|nr:isoleucine--tRNA ligase [Planctomycetota bacterium]